MQLARGALLLLVAPAATTAITIKLGLEWFLNPDHLPLVVALREGYFADAGLDVQLIAPADHWEAEEEILAGRLDVAVTETLHLSLLHIRRCRRTERRISRWLLCRSL